MLTLLVELYELTCVGEAYVAALTACIGKLRTPLDAIVKTGRSSEPGPMPA